MHLSPLRLIALALSALILSQALAPLANAQLFNPECEVLPGQSIQAAVDEAPDGGLVRVCAGVYAQQVLVRRSGVSIEGKPGAILDGTALIGTRFAFTLAHDVTRVNITGFEIRNYKDPVSSNDASSAILSLGATSFIRIGSNSIHDNAWAGILAAWGDDNQWRVENNTFEKHAFAHIFAQSSWALIVANNTFKATKQAVFLTAPHHATIRQNAFGGGGNAPRRHLATALRPSHA